MQTTYITTDDPARDLPDWKSRERAMKDHMELSMSNVKNIPSTFDRKGRKIERYST